MTSLMQMVKEIDGFYILVQGLCNGTVEVDRISQGLSLRFLNECIFELCQELPSMASSAV